MNKKRVSDLETLCYLVRKKRLELLRLTALVPKTSASTNSATLAGINKILTHVKINASRFKLPIVAQLLI